MIFTTLNTIITDIIDVATNSSQTRVNPLSRRQVEDWVHQYRAILLARELDRDNFVNPDYIQEIRGIKLETVNLDMTQVGDPGFPMEFDFIFQLIDSSGNSTGTGYLLRSVLEIPKTIDLNHKSGISFVGDATGNEIQFMPFFRHSWQAHKRYSNRFTMAALYNNRLIFSNQPSLDNITVRGVFQNPMEVGRFINPNNQKPFADYDTPYPIPNNLVPALKEMILSKELSIQTQVPIDYINDAKHSLQPTVTNNQ